MSKRTTPGPWRADGTQVIGADNQVVAVCRQAKPRNTMIALDNAKLLGAAHDLLEACKAAEMVMRNNIPHDRHNALIVLQTAISKAEGAS